MQLFPQGFYDQTDEAIGDGICDQTFIEANRVMPAHYRNRAGYADKSPNIAHAFAGRWEGRCGKECPNAREQKAHKRPHRNSIFHDHPQTSMILRLRVVRVPFCDARCFVTKITDKRIRKGKNSWKEEVRHES